jgi:hypothetical protein
MMLTRTEAASILAACGITHRTDYHQLSSAQVDALLSEADRRKYRKPANANGSRARYWYAYLCRRAFTPGLRTTQ